MAVHPHQKWILAIFISWRLYIITQSLACLTSLVLKIIGSRSIEISRYCYILIRILVLIILAGIVVGLWITHALILCILNWRLTRILFSILLTHRLRRWPHNVFIIIWVRGQTNRSTARNFITLARMRAWCKAMRILSSGLLFYCLSSNTYIGSHPEILRYWSLIKLGVLFSDNRKSWHFSF
jgi:hypothetical protein